MCKSCGETVDHLLLHCPIAYELWTMVFYLFGIYGTMLPKVIELLASWQGKFSQHQIIAIRRLVPHCLMWCIWREQNARCFESCEQSILQLKVVFFFTLLKWSLVLPTYSCFSLPVLIDYCNMGSRFFPL